MGALLQAQALGPLLPPETQRSLESSCIAAVKVRALGWAKDGTRDGSMMGTRVALVLALGWACDGHRGGTEMGTRMGTRVALGQAQGHTVGTRVALGWAQGLSRSCGLAGDPAPRCAHTCCPHARCALCQAKVEVAVAQELQLSEDTWAEEASSQELQEGLATRVTGVRAWTRRPPGTYT